MATATTTGKSGEELRFAANIERAQALGYDVDPDNCDPAVLEAGTRKIGALVQDLLGLDIDACDAVFAAAKVDPRSDMTDDQYERAVNRKSKGGLRGKALATWIVTGDSQTGARSSAKKRQARETRTATARKGVDTKATSARKRTAQEKADTRAAVDRARKVQASHDVLTAAGRKDPTGPREGSGLWAALQILKAARNPLTPDEIWDRIKAKKLAPGMKGKTPAATIGAQLATALKADKIPGLTRPEPGRYAITKGGK